jgi:hypothetical protein
MIWVLGISTSASQSSIICSNFQCWYFFRASCRVIHGGLSFQSPRPIKIVHQPNRYSENSDPFTLVQCLLNSKIQEGIRFINKGYTKFDCV